MTFRGVCGKSKFRIFLQLFPFLTGPNGNLDHWRPPNVFLWHLEQQKWGVFILQFLDPSPPPWGHLEQKTIGRFFLAVFGHILLFVASVVKENVGVYFIVFVNFGPPKCKLWSLDHWRPPNNLLGHLKQKHVGGCFCSFCHFWTSPPPAPQPATPLQILVIEDTQMTFSGI